MGGLGTDYSVLLKGTHDTNRRDLAQTRVRCEEMQLKKCYLETWGMMIPRRFGCTSDGNLEKKM